MRAPQAWAGLVAGLVVGCFSGDGTIGAICRDASDCGPDQGCRSEVCGRCGDGVAQTGELCLGDAAAVADTTAAAVLRVADLDGDGREDIVAWASGASAFEVYLVAPGGAVVASSVSVDAAIVDADPGDLDGDGAIDLALLLADRVAVAYGDGTGGFATPTDVDVVDGGLTLAALPMPGGTSRVAVTRDGTLHWWLVDGGRVVVGTGSAALSGGGPRLGKAVVLEAAAASGLVIGTADGMLTAWQVVDDGFVAGAAVAAGATPDRVVLTDVDGDGRTDAVALGADGTVGTVLSDGMGGLVPDESLDVGEAATGFAAIDLTRDSRRDYVVTTEVGVSVLVARGREHPDAVALDDAGPASDVWATDLDGDRRMELVLAGASGIVRREVAP